MLTDKIGRANDLQQIRIVARYELLKHLRRRRIYAVVVIAALIGALQLAVPLAYNIPFPQQGKQWASTFLGFASFLIITTGAFFGGDSISSEFELKTGYIVFANPVKRSSLVLGKFAAAFLASLVTIGFYYLIGTGAMLGIYGSVPIEVASSFGYACLYLCCVLGFTFLFSALLKGSMGATLLSFFLFLLIFSIVSQVISITGNEPWFLPSYASGMMTQVVNPQNDTVIVIPGSPVKLYSFQPKFPVSLIVLAGYFVVTLALSGVATKRKEMA